MITKDEQSKLRSTIALLSSMVNSGEQHSEQSIKEVSEALSIVNNLPILNVSNNEVTVCDHKYKLIYLTEAEEHYKCQICGNEYSKLITND